MRQNRVVMTQGATEFAEVMTAPEHTMILTMFIVVSSDALPHSRTNLSATAGSMPWNARGTTTQTTARMSATLSEWVVLSRFPGTDRTLVWKTLYRQVVEPTVSIMMFSGQSGTRMLVSGRLKNVTQTRRKVGAFCMTPMQKFETVCSMCGPETCTSVRTKLNGTVSGNVMSMTVSVTRKFRNIEGTSEMRTGGPRNRCRNAPLPYPRIYGRLPS